MKSLMHSLLFAGSLCVAAGLIGCGGKDVPLETAASVPAARGTAEATATDNDNTDLKVEVEHLAPPDKIASGASVYVVWAKPDTKEPAQNLGALVIDDDRKGSLRTTTPLKHFEVMVTPEASAAVQHPSNEPVMKAKVAR